MSYYDAELERAYIKTVGPAAEVSLKSLTGDPDATNKLAKLRDAMDAACIGNPGIVVLDALMYTAGNTLFELEGDAREEIARTAHAALDFYLQERRP